MRRVLLVYLILQTLLILYWTDWLILPLSSIALFLKANPASLFTLVPFITFGLAYYLEGWKRLALAGLGIIVLISLPFLYFYSLSVGSTPIKVVKLKELPDLYGIYRLIPLQTAYAYALDKIQIPTHTIYYSESYVYYNGTRPIYNWLIEPEGLNALVYGPLGAVFVYGDEYPPVVKVVKENLAWGLHNIKLKPLFADTLTFELIMRGAFGKELVYEDSVQITDSKKVITIIPLVDYEILFPGSIPYVKGFYVVYPNGTIDFVKPEELRFNIPLLPEKVARDWLERLKYRDWIQAVFLHNTFQIRDVGTNPQPYLLLDKKGNEWWVFVAEPPGNTYAAYKIFLLNASSTKPIVYEYDLKKPQIGISKVMSYVVKAHPNWAWNELSVQEPMPVIINGTIWWKVVITTRDGRGLISIDFLNAKNGIVKSYIVKGRVNSQELLEFLLNKEIKFTKNVTVAKLIKIIEKMKKELNELERLIREIR